MTKIKIFISFVVSLLALFVSGAWTIALAAPRLYLDPGATTVQKGIEFQITLGIDVESKQTTGAEIYLTYPSSDLELKSVTNAGFFTDFTTPTAGGGKINIRAYLSQTFATKTGSGTVAILKFTPKSESGTGVVGFTCSGSGNDTYILDSNVTNILSCGSLNQTNLTFSGQTSTQTNTPSTTSPTTGEANSCGGTCGSDINCKSGYFCYSGFCRNPSCPTLGNCVCTTARPTAKAKAVTTSTIKPSPQVVTLTNYVEPSPLADITPPGGIPDEGLENTTTQLTTRTYILIVGAAVLALVLLILIIKSLKKRLTKKDDSGFTQEVQAPFVPTPPVQTPPTFTPPVEVPSIPNPPAQNQTPNSQQNPGNPPNPAG